MIYDFRRRARPFREERIEVFTDGNDDYTYVLKSFFPMVNINYGQLVKIRNTHGKLLRKERRIIYGDPDEDDIDTVKVENFNEILREELSGWSGKQNASQRRKQDSYVPSPCFSSTGIS